MSLQGKVALVTGASRGIGQAIALELGRQGAIVIGTATSAAGAERIAATLKENGVQGTGMELNVTSDESVAAVLASIQAQFGAPAILVNNAGIGYMGSIEESEDAEVRWMFDINVFGLGRMTSAVLPGMRKQRSGAILNIASLAGIRAFPGLGYYNATKFAVVGLSGALKEEVGPLGIRVICVEPSGFRTPDHAGHLSQ